MSGVPQGLYVLGGPLPQRTPVQPDRPTLEEVVVRDIDRRLEDLFADVDELVERGEAMETPDEPLDDATIALCEQVCTRPGAVVELMSLHRRIGEGRLTWDDVWDAPADHDGGVRLLGEVMPLMAEVPSS